MIGNGKPDLVPDAELDGGGAGDIVAQVVHTKSSFFQVPPSLNGVK